MKHLRIFLFLSILISASSLFAFGQTPNFVSANGSEVMLQLLIKDDKASNLPKNLGDTDRRLKQIFPGGAFTLNDTYYGRTGDGGGISLRKILNLPAFDTDKFVYNEFILENVKITDGNARAARFVYSLRVPVKSVASDGKTPIYSYEQIGLTVNNLILQENTPTVIGTLTASAPNEIIVLVLTIKSDALQVK